MLPHGAQDLLAGGQIDPERLFGQQMLAGTDDIGIDLRVLVVRHGAVNGFDLRIFQKLVIIMVKNTACLARAGTSRGFLSVRLHAAMICGRGRSVCRCSQRMEALANSRPSARSR